MLSSWEELCIYVYVVAGNSPLECTTHQGEHIYTYLPPYKFVNTYIYIYIYIPLWVIEYIYAPLSPLHMSNSLSLNILDIGQKHLMYKHLFLSKKQTKHVWALKFGQSRKSSSNPRQYGTKKLLTTICGKLLLGPQYELGDQTVKVGKKASIKVSSLASWIDGKHSYR